MKTSLNKEIELEKSYESSKSIKIAILLLRKYRLLYEITGDNIYLKKGLACINERLQANKLDARLLLFKSLFEYMFNNKSEAMKCFKLVSGGIKYFKEQDTFIYLFIIYEKALFSTNHIFWKKQVEILLAYVNEYNISAILICDLYCRKKMYSECYEYLTIGFYNGSRSEMLYENLYLYFKNNSEAKDPSYLLFPLIRWCNRQNVEFDELLSLQNKNVALQVKNNYQLAMLIYDKQPDDFLLSKLCEVLVEKKIVTKKAFSLYLIASRKQMDIQHLNHLLIESSFHNSHENISYFFMKTYLEIDKPKLQLTGYVYYLLIYQEHLQPLLELYHNDILYYSIYSVKNDIVDKYHLSIYKYIILTCDTNNIENNYLSKMESILLQNLFNYHIKLSKNNIKHIMIKEPELAKCKTYEVNEMECTITASSSEFIYYFFSEDKKNTISDIPIIEPLVFSYDVDIYLYFYKKGVQQQELLITLSNYAIAKNIGKDNLLQILNEASILSGLDKNYFEMLQIHIGSLHVQKHEYAKSLQYFNNINCTKLTGDNIEKALIVFIETNNYDKAVTLLSTSKHKISESVLIYVLEKLQGAKEHYKEISGICYEIVLAGNVNLQLIKILLECHYYTFEELINFYRLLKNRNIFNNKLAVTIIKKCFLLKYCDTIIEEIFLHLHNRSKDETILEEYLIFIPYLVIAKDYIPSGETIKLLEINFKTNTYVLQSLAIIYAKLNIENIDMINLAIKEQEQAGILLPIYNDKYFESFNNNYVNMYTSFIYKCNSGSLVNMFYKTNKDKFYTKQEMTYFKFGIFTCKLIIFYDEKIEYYFENSDKSETSRSEKFYYKNISKKIINDSINKFDLICNGLIYQEQFNYQQVENTIQKVIEKEQMIIGLMLEE